MVRTGAGGGREYGEGGDGMMGGCLTDQGICKCCRKVGSVDRFS